MFLTDTEQSIPFNISMLDFDPAHIVHDTQNHTIRFQLNSDEVMEAATLFAYDIGCRQSWVWPAIDKTTVTFEIDYSRTFLRYSLRVGVQPQESPIETDEPDLSSEWAEFETQRQEAVQLHIQNGSVETTDLLDIVDRLAAKGIHLVSNKESIDTATPTGKLMLTMIAAINEFERTNLLERQREGIAIAKRQGKYKGRKEIAVVDFTAHYAWYMNREVSKSQLAKQLGISRPTLNKLIQQQEADHKMLVSN